MNYCVFSNYMQCNMCIKIIKIFRIFEEIDGFPFFFFYFNDKPLFIWVIQVCIKFSLFDCLGLI